MEYALSLYLRPRCRPARDILRHRWQQNGNARAARRNICDAGSAAVLLDDLLDDREPRPVPLGLVVT